MKEKPKVREERKKEPRDLERSNFLCVKWEKKICSVLLCQAGVWKARGLLTKRPSACLGSCLYSREERRCGARLIQSGRS